MDDDPALAAQIAEHDGLEALVPLIHGFAHGAPAQYWDFGPGREDTMPLYRLCRPRDVYCDPVDAPPIVDLLPGEAGYSPYGRVHEVRTTARWDGRRLASFADVDRAAAEGVVEAPRASNVYLQLPIAAADVRLSTGGGALAPEASVHVRGMRAHAFDFASMLGERPLRTNGQMLIRNVYVLTREGEAAPIHEAMRGADLTGDADLDDTNNVLGVLPSDPDYTPLWRVVRVTVPADYASIDTARDQAAADYRSSTDMFDVDPATYAITPRPGRVLAYEETDVLVDCPVVLP